MSAGDGAFKPAKPAWRPKKESVAPLEDLRHADMLSLRNRIADLCEAPNPGWLRDVGISLCALAVGGALGGLSMLQKGPTPTIEKVLYWLLVFVGFIFGVFSLCAYRTADRQRGDSLEAILRRFDELLASYEFVDATDQTSSVNEAG
jgi:hypothetical protein